MALLGLKQGSLLVMSNTFQKFLLLKMSRTINHLYFLSIYLTVMFFGWVILAILVPTKVFLILIYFMPIFPQNTFFSYVFSKDT